MDAVAILRSNLADAHWMLEQTIEDVSPEHLHWVPPGSANPIASTYAHVLTSEDELVQGTFLARPLLINDEWKGRSGISLPVPQRGGDWYAWGRRVRVDIPAARSYAAAVYAATDDFLAGIASDQLDRQPELALPGNQTLGWLIYNLLTQHAALHTGEIAVLKGLQGLAGYR